MSTDNTGAPEGGQTPPEGVVENTPPQRPENVPEAFWDAETGTVNTEALLASYTELATKNTPPENPEGDEGGAEGGDEGVPKEDDGTPPTTAELYSKAVEKATAELAAEGGALSEETYTAFAEIGIQREHLDRHVAGQMAMFELRKVYAEREVGGEDVYSNLLAWAGANYTPEEAEAYNATVFGPDKDAALQAVRQLKAKYEDTMGTDGKIVTAGTSGTPANGYAGRDDWMADMRKPEYKKNQVFRDEVRRKLEASLKAGVDMGIGASIR